MNLTFGCYVKKKLENLLKVDKNFFYVVSTQLDILSYYDDHRQSFLSGRGVPALPPPLQNTPICEEQTGAWRNRAFYYQHEGVRGDCSLFYYVLGS